MQLAKHERSGDDTREFLCNPSSGNKAHSTLRGRATGYKFFHTDAAQMEVRQLRSHFSQAQLSESKLMTSSAPKFLKAFSLLTLLRRALVHGRLRNQGHFGEHANTSFKT